jgi:hypothetical protein
MYAYVLPWQIEKSKYVIEFPDDVSWTTKALVIAFALTVEASFAPM